MITLYPVKGDLIPLQATAAMISSGSPRFTRFGPEWWDADYDTVTDFTRCDERSGENDLLVFGETWGPGFQADGENLYTSASMEQKADPTQYQIIGVTDPVDETGAILATVLNDAVLAGSGEWDE
ncbi:MAG: hypothetical protein U5K27_11310 [Desulfotignum sp.]|nr:hypothetical protein [Desulfotignum sp.]